MSLLTDEIVLFKNLNTKEVFEYSDVNGKFVATSS